MAKNVRHQDGKSQSRGRISHGCLRQHRKLGLTWGSTYCSSLACSGTLDSERKLNLTARGRWRGEEEREIKRKMGLRGEEEREKEHLLRGGPERHSPACGPPFPGKKRREKCPENCFEPLSERRKICKCPAISLPCGREFVRRSPAVLRKKLFRKKNKSLKIKRNLDRSPTAGWPSQFNTVF